MSGLDGFRDKSFMEQIAALSELERSKDASAIPDLLALYREPVGDAAVDAMLRNTLRALLANNENALLQALDSADRHVAQYATGIAGDTRLKKAVPSLMRLADEWTDDPETLYEVLFALGRIGDDAAVQLFRKHVTAGDDFIAALCIEYLGLLKDMGSQEIFQGFIDSNEEPDRFEQCDVTTWRAIDAMAALGDDKALEYLASKLHHLNPTARRIIHHALVEIGARSVSHLCTALKRAQDADQRIMASNVLGFIGGKEAGDCLVQALDDNLLQDVNERFAAYEALGNCKSIKSLVFLKDAVFIEQDALLVSAIINGLETQAADTALKALAEEFLETADKGGEHIRQVELILETLLMARAVKVFVALLQKAREENYQGTMRGKLQSTLEALETQAAGDTAMLQAFANALREKGFEEEAARLEDAQGNRVSTTGIRILAVDDSTAMRNFYIQACSSMGHEVVTAENGREALDLLEQGEHFDLYVVDMNMPVMDGIEFTTKARALEAQDGLRTPIVMASTEAAKSQAQLAKKAGVNNFIIKPFTKEVFQLKIRKILQ